MAEECRRKAKSVFGRKTREGTGVEHPKNTESSARAPRGRPGPGPGAGNGGGAKGARAGGNGAPWPDADPPGTADGHEKSRPEGAAFWGGEYRIRTDDLLHAMQAL